MAKTIEAVLNLAASEANPLSPTNLKQDITDMAGSLVLMQTFARVSAQQGIIDPTLIGPDADILSSLKQHQISARRNAEYLISTVGPATVGSITDLLAFSHTMNGFSKALTPLLPQMLAKPEARQQVLTLLNQLDFEAARRQSDSGTTLNLMTAAVNKAKTDYQNLQADAEEANKAATSSSGKLADIQKQIDDLHNKIGGEIAGVVVASVVIVAGGIVIAVGALATLPANVSAAAVIMPGIGMVVTGATTLATQASALAADNSRLADLYMQSAAISTTVTVVKAVAHQVDSVAEVAGALSDSMATVNTQWTNIRTGIGQIRQYLIQASDASDVAHALTAIQLAQNDWNAVAAESQSMLSRLVDLTPQDVDNILNPVAPREGDRILEPVALAA
ncbi:MAG TPA: HBL/NHE enterotoxin family protein [Bryobacteraceae bacterium]